NLIGGKGNDNLTGDAGPNAIDCGAGLDTVHIDLLDTVTACETIDAPVVPQGGGQPQGGGSLPQGGGGQPQGGGKSARKPGPKLSIAKRATRTGESLYVTIRCPTSADASCTGRLVLRTGKKTVGSAKFSIKAGKHRGVRVKASSRRHRFVATAT